MSSYKFVISFSQTKVFGHTKSLKDSLILRVTSLFILFFYVKLGQSMMARLNFLRWSLTDRLEKQYDVQGSPRASQCLALSVRLYLLLNRYYRMQLSKLLSLRPFSLLLCFSIRSKYIQIYSESRFSLGQQATCKSIKSYVKNFGRQIIEKNILKYERVICRFISQFCRVIFKSCNYSSFDYSILEIKGFNPSTLLGYFQPRIILLQKLLIQVKIYKSCGHLFQSFSPKFCNQSKQTVVWIGVKLTDLSVANPGLSNHPYCLDRSSLNNYIALRQSCLQRIPKGIFFIFYQPIVSYRIELLYSNISLISILNMARELFKNANVHNIKTLLQNFTGSPLANFSAFPKSFLVNNEPKDQWAQLQLQYADFKQAFCRFNLIARTCSQLNYHPELFNVYNRLVIKVYSTNSRFEKVLTPKDLYVSHFLDELQTKTVNQSHKAAIERVQTALVE